MSGQGVFCHQLPGNLPRQRLIDPALDVDFGKLIELGLGILVQLVAFAREIGAFGVAAAEATPTMRLAVEMMPSLAPRTAALNQPMRSMRWLSGCWRRRRMMPPD